LGQVDKSLVVVFEGIGGYGLMGFGQSVAEVIEQGGFFFEYLALVLEVGFQFGLALLEA